MKKLTKKKLENLIDKTFNKYAFGVQFNIMDLSKIMSQSKLSYENGLNLDDTMQRLIATYRVN